MTATSPLEIGRAGLRDIVLYSSGVGECAIDLSDNTNRFGAPPAALQALQGSGGEVMTRYPTEYGAALKEAFAAYVGVDPTEVVTGCGSDHVLDVAIRAMADPGDRLAYPNPTFSIIPTFARLNGLEPVPVPLLASYDIDADAMLATEARIVYLCSPNNPTGTAASRAAVERVLEHAPGIVILDEAYAEFAGTSYATRAAEHGRLLVTRTMSKAFGLAGLRVGFGVAAPELVREIEKSRGPYTVSSVAERAALAALTEDVRWMREYAAEAVENRARFASALTVLGLRALPSSANFVLVPVPDARHAALALAERGIAVRPFVNLPEIGGALRITVAPWPVMEQTLDAMRAALA